jgi:hypothetical protein
MKVLVDTSIWSLALRRASVISEDDRILLAELQELINEVRVAIIGPIRQELLSGISTKVQFDALQTHLKAFEDLSITRKDYERAAEFYNTCRQSGIQGSHIDFLICSVSAGAGIPIFTSDKDFLGYIKFLPINLHPPRV